MLMQKGRPIWNETISSTLLIGQDEPSEWQKHLIAQLRNFDDNQFKIDIYSSKTLA